MATAQSRKARGMQTQALVADYFRTHGWPYAQPAGAGRNGVDVTGTPGLAIEVKARREFKPEAWLRQAGAQSGLSFVVWRPDGVGPASIGRWSVMLRLDDLAELLRLAGYGDTDLA